MRTIEKIVGVVVSLDFSTLQERICQGIDRPDDEDSDYELWSPSGSDNQ